MTCDICKQGVSKGRAYSTMWVCDDCEAWASGRLSRNAPGGYPPRSGLSWLVGHEPTKEKAG